MSLITILDGNARHNASDNIQVYLTIDRPVPVEQVKVEHDGAEHKIVLQQKSLGVLLLSAEQYHLGRPQFFVRQLLDVLQELNLVRLSNRQITGTTVTTNIIIINIINIVYANFSTLHETDSFTYQYLLFKL